MRSLNIELPDPIYEETQRAATAAGFPDVEAYVVDLLAQDAENFDHLFTPERLAIIDRADAEASAGKVFTMEQYEAHLAEVKAEWRRNNPL